MSEPFRTPQATYVLVETLRERPTGATHVVRRESDGQSFILKELRIGGLDGWKHFDLFEREIAVIRSVEHPRVPRYVDSHLEEATGRFLLVQTRIEGTTLRDVLESRMTLGPEQTISYLRQALELLDHLHGSSPPVVHRDITPSNIIVQGPDLYLIDFGAVKVGTFESTSMTTVGTFGYMAPEQILGRATSQSDLYGLGMTFVALATGREPGQIPQNPSTGQIDAGSLLAQAPVNLQRTLLALIRPGIGERVATARQALMLLDPRYAPTPHAVAVNPTYRFISPYQTPSALSERDRAFLRHHTLREFPLWAAVMLHFFTFGLFSIVHYGMQHDNFPKAASNDPSAAKAIGFSFIPYFNLYWCVFAPLRLAERINLQSQLRGRGDAVPHSLILICGLLGVIPYINILFGLPVWALGVYRLQKAINELARENNLSPGNAPPALEPARSPSDIGSGR